MISAIIKAQADINEDSMSNILETVINKKELDEIRKVLKRAYAGDTVISHGKYYYSENGVDFDFRNISAGLKSFALIERMLETGVLKKKIFSFLTNLRSISILNGKLSTPNLLLLFKNILI